MSELPAPAPIEALLAHRAWVRMLARHLVRDENQADDLEQQTYLAVLEKPPADDRSARGWLATVLRRAASRGRRSASRVERRERVAARPEAAPATVDVVEQAELHGRVVRAVLELPDPFRRTLLLRYFEDLSPEEVASRTGAPVATVRTRTHRALALLRDRFDREHGGDRKAWLAALAPLAAPPSGAVPAGTASAVATAASGSLASIAGVAAMTAKSKTLLAAAILLLLLAGGTVWLAPWRDAEAPKPAGGGRQLAAAPETRPTLAKAPAGSAKRRRAAAAADPAAPTADEPMDPNDPGEIRFVAGEGKDAPPVRASFTLVPAPGGTNGSIGGTSMADGYTDVMHELKPPVTLWAWADGFALRRMTGLDLKGKSLLVVLEPAREVSIEFRSGDGEGTPIPGAEAKRRFDAAGTPLLVRLVPETALIGADAGGALDKILSFDSPWAFDGALRLSEGGATIDHALEKGTWWALVPRPLSMPSLVRFSVSESGAVAPVVVRLPSTPATVRVRFVDATTREPLAKARVRTEFEFGDDYAFLEGSVLVADARGEVDLPLPEPTGSGLRAPTIWVEDATHAAAIRERDLAGLFANDSRDWPVTRTATIVGQAYLKSGEPAAAREVFAGRKGRMLHAVTNAQGRFTLQGIAADSDEASSVGVSLVEDAAALVVATESVAVKAGETSQIVIGHPRGNGPTATVRGRFTAGGRPLPGLLVGIQRPTAPGQDKKMAMTKTDAEGRFVIDGLAPGEARFMALLGDSRVSDDSTLVTPKGWTLVAGREEVFEVDLPAGVLRVRVLDDATGKPVPGAMVAAVPESSNGLGDRYPGLVWSPGWCVVADADGVATLVGLPTGSPHHVMSAEMGTTSRTGAETKGALPGTADAPTELTLRLKSPAGR